MTGNGELVISKASFAGTLPKSEMPTSIIISRIGGNFPVSEKYLHECEPNELLMATLMRDHYKEEYWRVRLELDESKKRARLFRDFISKQSRTNHNLHDLLRKASRPSLFSRITRLFRIGR